MIRAANRGAMLVLVALPWLAAVPEAAEPCAWQVTASRAAREGEVPFESKRALLREPENPNRVPGPGALRAVVRTDARHHPHVYVEDTLRGSSRALTDRWASEPRWSPDGTRIACSVWVSQQRPWQLCIVDVASGRARLPEIGGNAALFKWSPDSRSIAVGATLYGQPTSVLMWHDVASGRSRTLDTLAVFADYELGWSPDSRALVVSRPTRVLSTEDVAEAELWIFDRASHRCRLVASDGCVNHEPGWIDGQRILYVREKLGDPGSPRILVLELAGAAARVR